jgi:hypothetical protein
VLVASGIRADQRCSSDFPSLSDNTQSQNHPSAQSFWGSRNLQQDPTPQRSQHSPPQQRVPGRQQRQDMFSGSATTGIDSDRFSAEGAFGHNRQSQNETSDGWPRIGEAARQQDSAHQDNYGSSGFGSSSLLSGLERQRTNTNPTAALLGSQDPSRVTSPEGTSQSCTYNAFSHFSH